MFRRKQACTLLQNSNTAKSKSLQQLHCNMISLYMFTRNNQKKPVEPVNCILFFFCVLRTGHVWPKSIHEDSYTSLNPQTFQNTCWKNSLRTFMKLSLECVKVWHIQFTTMLQYDPWISCSWQKFSTLQCYINSLMKSMNFIARFKLQKFYGCQCKFFFEILEMSNNNWSSPPLRAADLHKKVSQYWTNADHCTTTLIRNGYPSGVWKEGLQCDPPACHAHQGVGT
jgi:hypothetical protein